MESFTGKIDAQRLAKLERRLVEESPSNGSTSNGPHTVTASITAMASVATPAPPEFSVGMNNSESDNSQTDGSPIEDINELKIKSVAKTPEQTNRRGKRKQDTPQENRRTKNPATNQKPIDSYFASSEVARTPRRGTDNGVARSLQMTSNSDQSNDNSGITPLEPTTPTSSRPKRARPSPTNRSTDCQTDMTLSQLELLEAGQVQKANAEKDVMFRQNLRLEMELKQAKELAGSFEDKFTRCINLTKNMLIEKCNHEKREARRKSMEDRIRLGEWSSSYSVSSRDSEKWLNGQAFITLEDREAQLETVKKKIETERKVLSRRRPPSTTASGSSRQRENALSLDEYNMQDMILKNRSKALKEDEAEINYDRDKLHRERSLHIREMKRIINEDNSKYSTNVELHSRYLLLNLLGKGGFSEVYKAYDFDAQKFVAIKIHQLNQYWTDQKKTDYQRHAHREAEIQKIINHSKIVRLYDRFEVDINTFCTVLEYCEGNDLDIYLKQHSKISEQEAKSVIMQIVQALKYLNELEHPVIHYDLKPGNVLLADGSVCGNIKITDFGLSKQILDGDQQDGGIELTSQGAGTYWYLPPECFSRPNGGPPIIDNRVDVWSIGVIFYQCIYGKKPFGHNQSQQQILENKTIVNATEVNFPPKPTLSQDAKDFIRSCLIYRKEDRADIFALASHHYFKVPNRRPAVPRNPPGIFNENSN